MRIQFVRYHKRYLTKAVHECRRYFFYIPVHLAERIDPSADYEVQLREPYVIFVPKQIDSYQDAIEQFEKKWSSVPNLEVGQNHERHVFRRRLEGAEGF